MSKTAEVRLVVPGEQQMVDLLGRQDELLKIIEKEFDSQILVRGNEITISGLESETDTVASIFRELMKLISQGQALNAESVASAIRLFRDDGVAASDVLSEPMLTHRGKSIRAKTLAQRRYIDAINDNVLTFVIGPAGTGKTYLAMANAVKALKERRVARIILTRPAVEAGERLGFLPGDIYQKVDPYLRPLYDAVYDMMEGSQFRRFLDQGVIEIAPLAFMRGRTLNDSFIILDEAQNTSPEQMKMFLTRLGFGSRAIVTGDVTQVDLPRGEKSGLKVVQEILSGIEGTAFIRLTARDVVRHRIVQRIVEAYKRFEDQGRGSGAVSG